MSDGAGLIEWQESLDPIEDLLKKKDFKTAATADGDTDEKEVEKKRRYLSALNRIARENMTQALKLADKLKDKELKQDDRKEVNEEFQRLFILHQMLGVTGNIHGLGVIADCLSVRMEDDIAVRDPKTGEVKVRKRLTRLTAAEILATNLDDPETGVEFVEKADLNVLAEMFYLFMRKVHPESLREKVTYTDHLGVQRTEEVDIIEHNMKLHAEKMRAAEEASKREGGGIFEDEAAAVENAGVDELFGEQKP